MEGRQLQGPVDIPRLTGPGSPLEYHGAFLRGYWEGRGCEFRRAGTRVVSVPQAVGTSHACETESLALGKRGGASGGPRQAP